MKHILPIVTHFRVGCCLTNQAPSILLIYPREKVEVPIVLLLRSQVILAEPSLTIRMKLILHRCEDVIRWQLLILREELGLKSLRIVESLRLYHPAPVPLLLQLLPHRLQAVTLHLLELLLNGRSIIGLLVREELLVIILHLEVLIKVCVLLGLTCHGYHRDRCLATSHTISMFLPFCLNHGDPVQVCLALLVTLEPRHSVLRLPEGVLQFGELLLNGLATRGGAVFPRRHRLHVEPCQ